MLTKIVAFAFIHAGCLLGNSAYAESNGANISTVERRWLVMKGPHDDLLVLPGRIVSRGDRKISVQTDRGLYVLPYTSSKVYMFEDPSDEETYEINGVSTKGHIVGVRKTSSMTRLLFQVSGSQRFEILEIPRSLLTCERGLKHL